MPGKSSANPYNAGIGTNDHVMLLNKGVKPHNLLDVQTDIHALAEKPLPIGADEIAIDDSADYYNRKKIKVSSISNTAPYPGDPYINNLADARITNALADPGGAITVQIDAEIGEIPVASTGVKGMVIPDGVATHYYDGIGTWTTPSGGGTTKAFAFFIG